MKAPLRNQVIQPTGTQEHIVFNCIYCNRSTFKHPARDSITVESPYTGIVYKCHSDCHIMNADVNFALLHIYYGNWIPASINPLVKHLVSC